MSYAKQTKFSSCSDDGAAPGGITAPVTALRSRQAAAPAAGYAARGCRGGLLRVWRDMAEHLLVRGAGISAAGLMREFLEKHRARVAAQGLRKTLLYYVFTVALQKLGVELMYVFEHRLDSRAGQAPDLTADDVSTTIVDTFDALTASDLEALRQYGGAELLQEFAAAFARGERCAVSRLRDARPASACWIIAVSESYADRASPGLLIERCFTLPDMRGRGIYPLLLARVSQVLRMRDGRPQRIFVKSSIFNESSIRGIQKAGFTRIGRIVSFAGNVHYRPLHQG